MGSIVEYIDVRADPPEVWDAICDFGAPHERLAPGFVVAAEIVGNDRIITFASGATAIEGQIRFTHHQSSVEVAVVPGTTGCQIVWTADLLPDEVEEMVDGLMSAGAGAMDQRFNR